MAAAPHTKVTLQRNLTGYNLTDSVDFTLLVAGAGNGVTYAFDPADVVIIKNTQVGAAVFTFTVPAPASFATVGATVVSPTVNLAAGKTMIVRLADLFKNAASGDAVVITCDIAGSVLVIKMP